MSKDKIKICRWCHKIYESPFCGNGCERDKVFRKNVEGDDIEPREIVLDENESETVRWVCLACKSDFSEGKLQNTNWICPQCEQKNDFYPYTKKACVNCKEDGEYRKLPIWAKACEKCGKAEFIINGEKKVTELKPTFEDKSFIVSSGKNSKGDVVNSWEGPPPIFDKGESVKEEKESKNLISLTFTILSNNYEVVLFAEGKKINLYDFIKQSNGFIPDDIYAKLLEKYSREETIFEINFQEENEQFSMKSVFPLKFQELNPRYEPLGEQKTISEGQFLTLEENKLIRLIVPLESADFTLKGQIWVY